MINSRFFIKIAREARIFCIKFKMVLCTVCVSYGDKTATVLHFGAMITI